MSDNDNLYYRIWNGAESDAATSTVYTYRREDGSATKPNPDNKVGRNIQKKNHTSNVVHTIHLIHY
jgi:hypothetical protein